MHCSVVTVGICPAWDITCKADDLDWGKHSKVFQTSEPAGKALNVSRALAWMGEKSINAGLWGKIDWPLAKEALSELKPLIDFRFTIVPGQTRQNITVIDTRLNREMHLRDECRLSTKSSLKQLNNNLLKIVDECNVIVFSGSLPGGELLTECLSIIKNICERGSKVVVDSSGIALKKAVATGDLYMIKPNLEELGQLLSRRISNESSEIVAAARKLCDSVDIVLVSRGADGALAVTRDQACQCHIKAEHRKAANTVACGDYLLAGFLAGDEKMELCARLENGVKVATVRAWGLSGTMDWPTAKATIKLETQYF